MISFDFGAYVKENSTKIDRQDRKEKRNKKSSRHKVLQVASKVASVAREVLDIYSAVKRKDPVSVVLGAISTYGCVSELFEGEPLRAQERLKEMGVIKAFPMMCEFIFHTLKQMDIISRRIWSSGKNENDDNMSNGCIEEFDLGQNIKIWFISSGTEGPDQGPYVINIQEFTKRFSEVVEEKLGKILTINTIIKGWDEFFYLGPLRIPTALYVSHIDEDALMTRVFDLQKLGFNRSLLFFGPAGIGKAQPLDAKVLTSKGFVEMGTLKIGDQVLTPDGTSANIVGVFPQGKIDTYRVYFTDRTYTECSSDHLWLTSSCAERGWRKVNKSVKSLNQISSSLVYNNKRNHSVPLINGKIDFTSSTLPLDPYLLGILIGEGDFTNSTPKVSNCNFGLVQNLRRKLGKIGCKLVHIKKGDYRIVKIYHRPNNWKKIDNRSVVAKALVDLNLRDHKAQDKFVPDIYKLSTFDNRLSMLRGLLDSGGDMPFGASVVEFTSSSKQLACDVIFLVQSLGGKATMSTSKAHYTIDKIRHPAHDKHRVGIIFPPHLIPFKIGYKVKAYKNYSSKAKFLPRYIDDIAYIGKRESQCIAIDHPDGLYITNDFIVTHNTTLSARLAEKIGGRLLVASCGTLETPRGRSIVEDLIDVIDPSVILLDDLDKMWRPSEMLESMERLNRKVSEHKRLLIGTVNSLTQIPEPLRRPGRFDEIVEFYPLTKLQRKNILTTYGKEFNVKYSDREFNKLADKTEGMTGAYLKEIALRASVLSFDPMCVQVEQMKRICNMEEEDDDEEEKPPKKKQRTKGTPRTQFKLSPYSRVR